MNGEIPPNGYPGDGSDLMLTEEPKRKLTWVLAETGLSCNEHCQNLSAVCNGSALSSDISQTAVGIEKLTAAGVGCEHPFQASCQEVTPAIGNNGVCYFNAANFSLCADKGFKIQSTCHSKEPTATRMCACSYNHNIGLLNNKDNNIDKTYHRICGRTEEGEEKEGEAARDNMPHETGEKEEKVKTTTPVARSIVTRRKMSGISSHNLFSTVHLQFLPLLFASSVVILIWTTLLYRWRKMV